MEKKKNQWALPSLIGFIIGIFFFLLSLKFLEACSIQETSKIVNSLAIQFAFTFLGILISAYAILQVIASNVECPNIKLKTTDQKLYWKMLGRYKLLRSSVFDKFKNSMMHLMIMTLVFLILCILMIPLLGIKNYFVILTITTIQIFGISFLAISSIQHIRSLFSAI